jgi:protein TonB
MPAPQFPYRIAGALAASLACLLAACSSVPLQTPPSPAPTPPAAAKAPPPVVTPPAAAAAPAAPAPAPIVVAPPAPAAATAAPGAQAARGPQPSQAPTALAYRRDAARHLYEGNRARIFPGRLPPMLYAIGVLDVELDGQGQVRGLSWQRAPRHAPEVIAEIERTVRAAAPFPAPARMGRVVYTDVWLWDRSGRFQLDTLTEGQH